MSTRKETERTKLIQDKCQKLLTQMLRDEDNKYCVDCDAKGPRWASWNLGVFLCIRCAGIHRNLGVHISRVKSVNLDAWTPEQVVSLQQMGNSRARAVYEAQLPDGFRRPQTDSALESFIRAKYEHKKYLAREWVPPSPPKVDWDKEIDEEIEKQKRKKKASQSTSGLNIVTPITTDKKTVIKSPIPAPLPKPKSANSPKTNRTEANQAAVGPDLLGLSSPTNSSGPITKSGGNDLQADSFSSFLSGPVVGQASVNGTSGQGEIKSSDNNDLGLNTLAKEEADFFNQSALSATSDKDKAKLTKDSIMALYGTVPSNNIGQFNNNPLVGFNSTFNHPSGGPTGGPFMQMGPVGQTQTFPTLATAPGLASQQASFGHAGVGTNLNLNLAGMPPGLLGPPQPQPHTQFMTPPTSGTMYNQPVMTAPGAFSAGVPPQIVPQPTFAQFPTQPFPSMQQSFSPAMGTAIPGTATPVVPSMSPAPANLSQQFGNLNLGNVWQ